MNKHLSSVIVVITSICLHSSCIQDTKTNHSEQSVQITNPRLAVQDSVSPKASRTVQGQVFKSDSSSAPKFYLELTKLGATQMKFKLVCHTSTGEKMFTGEAKTVFAFDENERQYIPEQSPIYDESRQKEIIADTTFQTPDISPLDVSFSLERRTNSCVFIYIGDRAPKDLQGKSLFLYKFN